MIKKKFQIIACIVIFINFTFMIMATVNLYDTNNKLSELRIKFNNAIEFPTATSQPRMMVKVTYRKENLTVRTISAYDDFIDVGNEKLNQKLMFAILSKREHELICPELPLEIEIYETRDKAKVRIHWAESVQMFSVLL